jgi:N-methylhydantoinase A
VTSSPTIRLGVDIGGTFTDVALETAEGRFTAKILTTPQAPEEGVLAALRSVLAKAGVEPGQVNLIVHGTTLATNALIERKGASTALLTTEGFRDVLEIRHENRFEQYDINIDLPPPLVPRQLRLPIRERVDAHGEVLVPLDESSVTRAVEALAAQQVEAVAVGFLHSFTNPDHERRVGDAIARRLPEVAVTLSSEVSPEMREYERFSTACANAYLQPLIGRYLVKLERELVLAGFHCPLLLMTSGGGITTTETAIRFPVRLVESGPAGGAIFAACIARQHGLDQVVSFDMGGTTAKICLIDKAQPQTARAFEVARVYRFLKGSGLPLRIPVIEMVEIGAGGGSIARVDTLRRIVVGPDSAGSEPGPVCYGRGGKEPTVTDADLGLGESIRRLSRAAECLSTSRVLCEPSPSGSEVQ